MPTKTKRHPKKIGSTKLLRSNLEKLPVSCLALDSFSMADAGKNARIVCIERGKQGFRRAGTAYLEAVRGMTSCRAWIDSVHSIWSVTRQQEAAMLAGSFGGFGIPAADPDNYAPDGRSKRVVEREQKLHAAAPQMLGLLRRFFSHEDHPAYLAEIETILAQFPED